VNKALTRFLGTILVAGAVGVPCWAVQLGIRTLTVADGLAGDTINCLLQDEDLFLWIGTRNGLTRFDGNSFISYTRSDGLPHSSISCLAEDREGRLWVGTAAGLSRLKVQRDANGLVFDTFSLGTTGRPRLIHDVVVDGDSLWVAAGGTLFRGRTGVDDPAFEDINLPISWGPMVGPEVGALALAPDGSLWIGTAMGLFRRLPNGDVLEYPLEPKPGRTRVTALGVDALGRVWCPSQGILVFLPEPAADAKGFSVYGGVTNAGPSFTLPQRTGEALRFSVPGALGGWWALGFHQSDTDTMWVATPHGAFEIGSSSLRIITTDQGLAENSLQCIIEDRCSNIWIGCDSRGLMELSRDGFRNFSREDGMATEGVSSVTSGPDGRPVIVGFPPSSWIHRVDGDGVVPIKIPLPPGVPGNTWGLNQVTFMDHLGQWWVPTQGGALRFPRLEHIDDLAAGTPDLFLTKEKGLGGEGVFRLWEDQQGDVWMGVLRPSRLVRWIRESGKIEIVETGGSPLEDVGTAFAEDLGGTVWIGLYSGRIARFRRGRLEFIDPFPEEPKNFINAIKVDRRGRLWIGTLGGGLIFTENPEEERPRWSRMGKKDGLAADTIMSLAEDLQGKIWLGTSRGLDRLDHETGSIAHFDTSNGLISNTIQGSWSSDDGSLWFATPSGASHLQPHLSEISPPPVIRILRVSVQGRSFTVPELGIRELRLGTLRAGDHLMEIGLTCVDFVPGRIVRYQYSFDLSETWCSPMEQSRLQLAGLGAGHYNLRIRVVGNDGSLSDEAGIIFRIPPPWWKSWWFLGLCALLPLGFIGLFQHVRVQRILAEKQLRERIGADLHDEIGLGLTRIAMLSDIAGLRQGDDGPSEELDGIGEEARQLIDSTGDLAWALNPTHDELQSLLTRLRRLMSNVFEPSGIRWRLDASQTTDISLDGERRRHLFLILKEALNNVARHAQATQVVVEIHVRDRRLLTTIRDDGRGFDLDAARISGMGNGLQSMTQRALALGGDFQIQSSPKSGTVISLSIPL
jgi:ligand-binding sensor domain-containing protein